MKKLRQKYKMEKDNSRKSGNGTAKKKQWKYSSKIDNLHQRSTLLIPYPSWTQRQLQTTDI